MKREEERVARDEAHHYDSQCERWDGNRKPYRKNPLGDEKGKDVASLRFQSIFNGDAI
jgi:hypothetical protein